MTWFTSLLLVLQLTNGQSPASPVERLQAKIPVSLISEAVTERLAGKYKNPPSELIKQIGGTLSGDELYLFPDKTYIYCEWADVQPLTVYDKGTWVFSGGYFEFTSDPEVTWSLRLERRYVAVHRNSHRNEVLLVGTGRGLSYFESEAGNDPETMLLILAKGREKNIKRSKAAKLKAKIMNESWRPDEFSVHER